jgi:hypothetical protein
MAEGGSAGRRAPAPCDRRLPAGWGDYSPYAKGNFSFERVICDWRTRVAVLDLRLKK